MLTYFTKKLNSLKEALKNLEEQNKSPLEKSQEALNIINQLDDEFKKVIKESKFKDTKEEIHYFKSQRPQLLADQIYYARIYRLETNKPYGSPKTIKKHYKRELEKIHEFFSANFDFIQYMRTGQTIADEMLFTRNNINYLSVKESIYSSLDKEQTTNFDHKAGKLLAAERLQDYLISRIKSLKKAPATMNKPTNDILPEKWIKTHQVLRLLAISESTLQKMRKNGEIPFTKIRGILYYRESDIHLILSRNQKRFID